jgi:hypothetical protein
MPLLATKRGCTHRSRRSTLTLRCNVLAALRWRRRAQHKREGKASRRTPALRHAASSCTAVSARRGWRGALRLAVPHARCRELDLALGARQRQGAARSVAPQKSAGPSCLGCRLLHAAQEPAPCLGTRASAFRRPEVPSCSPAAPPLPAMQSQIAPSGTRTHAARWGDFAT